MKEKNRARLERQREETRNHRLLGPSLARFSNPNEIPRLSHSRNRALSLSLSGGGYGVNSVFGKIPLEIRQEILTLAFGHDIIHIEFMFEHPEFSYTSDQSYKGHCSTATPNDRKNLNVDLNQPKRWRWFSCICHDVKPPHLRGLWDRYDSSHRRIDDSCCLGFATHCNSWPGSQSRIKCQVGVMGWLLSCRQAYIEGIHILFAKNSFHMTSQPLLANIDRLIRPQRLAEIKSLYVVWPLVLAQQPIGHEGHKMRVKTRNLKTLLDKLSSHFCGLKELNIQFKSSEPLVETTLDLDEIFQPLDLFFTTHPRLQDFTVTLSSTLFHYMVDSSLPRVETLHDSLVKHPHRGRIEYWRDLNGNFFQTGMLDMPYPTSPHASRGELSGEKGYWILEGENDEPLAESDDDDGITGFILVD